MQAVEKPLRFEPLMRAQPHVSLDDVAEDVGEEGNERGRVREGGTGCAHLRLITVFEPGCNWATSGVLNFVHNLMHCFLQFRFNIILPPLPSLRLATPFSCFLNVLINVVVLATYTAHHILLHLTILTIMLLNPLKPALNSFFLGPNTFLLIISNCVDQC